MAPKKGFPAWLIALLVVLAFFVLIIGTLGALAVHGFRQYLAAAKTAEARMNVGRMAKDASAAFDREHVDPSGAVSNSLCASASSPVPKSSVSVKGTKYQSNPSEWQIDKPTDAGFACLGFQVAEPQVYQYDYKASGTNKPGDQFLATAHGDLNGDGVMSTFTLEGRVTPAGTLLVSPSLLETDPGE